MPKKSDPFQTIVTDARLTQILDAAKQVFAALGFHDATIHQVAQTAGIADGTIYLYFENKDDLLLGVLNQLNESERRAQDFDAKFDGDLRTFMLQYIRHRLQVMDNNFQGFHAVLPTLLANPVLRARYMTEIVEPSFALAEPFYEHLIQTGVLKPNPARLTLRATSSLVLGLLVLRMLGDQTVAQQWNNLPEFLTDMALNGLAQEQPNEHTHPPPKRTRPKTKTARHHHA